MFNGNGYPLGSTYDPNAPWNRDEHTCTKKVDVFIKNCSQQSKWK